MRFVKWIFKSLYSLIFSLAWVVIIISFVLYMIPSSDTQDNVTVDIAELRSTLVELSYDDLARYPTENKGKPVRYTGKITQKISATALSVQINQSEYGTWKDAVYVELKGDGGDINFLEGDIIKFIGHTNGEYVGRAVLGQRLAMPKISAYEIELIKKRE